MYKIKNIRLNNFKFFFGEQNLKLDKKHTLIYGENGSGKSSIYWALHCFLHSTLKPNVESVQKYFLPISQSDESIKNRYAQDAEKSGVSITLEHLDYERYANINAEISNNVVNTQTNHEIKLMALSSELINYKVVYNMYLATNKSTIKLFSYFEKNLLEFIDFDQELYTIYGPKISRNSLDWWRYIKKGMQPYTTMQDPNYGTFQGHVALFNQKLSDYLQLVTRETNRSLQEDFKANYNSVISKINDYVFRHYYYKNAESDLETLESLEDIDETLNGVYAGEETWTDDDGTYTEVVTTGGIDQDIENMIALLRTLHPEANDQIDTIGNGRFMGRGMENEE